MELPPWQSYVQQLGNQLLSAAALALAVLPLAAVLWWSLRRQGGRVLPRQHFRAVPWSGVEVLLVYLMAFAFILPFVAWILFQVDFFSWLYPGFDLGDLLRNRQGPLSAQDQLRVKPWAERISLWVALWGFPFQLTALLLVPRRWSGTRPYQLGLSTWRWPGAVLAGYIAFVLLVPVVLTVNILANYCYQQLTQVPPTPHPFIRLSQESPPAWERVAVACATILAAPVLEELFFRGILLRWLTRWAWAGLAVMAAAFAASFQGEGDNFARAPAIFVLVMVPGFLCIEPLAWRLLPYPNVARAIYASALLFAALHSHVWPTPIALFILGLGLGYLAIRTQSLLAPILCHALFNTVPNLVLWLETHRLSP